MHHILDRLQDIAGRVEKCFFTPWFACSDSPDYKLALVSTLIDCIQTCWKQGVFLHSLSHRFWKLTLQILSRYITWLTSLGNNEASILIKASMIRLCCSLIQFYKNAFHRSDKRLYQLSQSTSGVSFTPPIHKSLNIFHASVV